MNIENNTKILATYLKKNDNDNFYKEIKDIRVEEELRKKFSNEMITKYSKKFPLWKKNYINSCTFTEYILNIYKNLDTKNGNGYTKTLMGNIAETINKDLNINDLNLTQHLIIRWIYNIYIGFVFEEMFAELFADFKITSNNRLDMDKIDMLIEYTDKRIGIQFKNISYLRVSNYTKDKNKNVLKGSKRTHKLNMIVYAFHNDKGQPLLLKRKVFDTIEVDKEIYFMDYEETNEHDNEHNYNAYEVTNEEDIIKAFKEMFIV